MSHPRRRILYVTSCWPHGPSFGGQLRTLHIGRALQSIGEVTLAVVSFDPPGEHVLHQAGTEFQVEPPIRVEVHPNRTLAERLRWALDPKFLNVHGCLAHPADRARLLDRFGQSDLVWVSNSRTANILNQWRWPHSVLDIDDVPSTFQRSVWQNGASLKEKLKAGVQTVLLKRRERRFHERFTVLSVCSEADRRYLGGSNQIHVIPNGFERPATVPVRKPASPPRLGFIGLYSYPPNLEGVQWFVQHCWPLVKAQVPEARLRLVGKDTDGPLKPTGTDIEALGWMKDPADEVATWSAMIVPVRHGAGTRVKIADAFSRKCPVVSTHLGAHGYDIAHSRELMLADEPREFAASCVALLKDSAAGSALAERAFAAFLKHWTWDAIAHRVWAAAERAFKSSEI